MKPPQNDAELNYSDTSEQKYTPNELMNVQPTRATERCKIFYEKVEELELI